MKRRGKSFFIGSFLLLSFLAIFLAVGTREAGALHSDYMGGVNACYICHNLSATPTAVDDNPYTSYILVSKLIESQGLNSGVTPDIVGCTFCHQYSTSTKTQFMKNTARMKEVRTQFSGSEGYVDPKRHHPVDRSWSLEGNDNVQRNVLLDGYMINNIVMSAWNNVTDNYLSWTRPAGQIGCTDCHDATLYGETYPDHPVLWKADNTADTGSQRYNNPYMLRNVTSWNWSGGQPTGQAPDSFCLQTCHDQSAPNQAKGTSMGHYGWGGYGRGGNTLKEPSGTALKKSACTDCHETHFSGNSTPGLMGEGRMSANVINDANCAAVCHDETAWTNSGHRKGLAAGYTCTSCHTTDVSHRDPANPQRLTNWTGVDTRVSDVFTNVSNDNVDNNHNGLVDAADTRSPENQFKRSLVSTCNNCHQNHLYHNGSIGGVNGQASCLDCHDPHGKGVSRSPTDNNTYMIRTSVIGKATVFKSTATDTVKDYYRADGTGVCDNPNCHAKPLGPKGTPGTIMEDVPEHRNNPQVVPGSDCSQCHSHTSATASFVPNCSGCHDYTGQPHTVGAHVLSPVHDRHYKAFADNGYAFECFQCHSNNIHNESNMSDKSQWGTSISHLTISNNVDVIFDNTRNPGTDNSSYSPAKLSRTTPGAGTCSGLTCHGANLPAGAKGEDQTPTWNQPSSGACGSCHRVYTSAQKMATGTHTEHADNVSGYGFGCNVCHYQTTSNGLTIDNTSTARALHLDNSSEVTFNTADWRFSAGPTYTGTLIVGDAGGTCTNVYCHSKGAGQTSPYGGVAVTPPWDNTAKLQCNACHGSGADNTGTPAYASGSPKINSHAKHVSMGYGCQACHVTTTSTGTTITNRANHVNGTYQASPDNAAHSFTTPYVSPDCSNIACHGGNTAAWGGAAPQCGGCHLAAADSDQYQAASDNWYRNDATGTLDNTEWTYSGHGKDALQNYDASGHPGAGFISRSNGGDPCYYCHDPAVGHRLAGNPFRLKNQTGVSGYANAGWNATCLVCHSKAQPPPGYLPAIGYTTITAAANDRVDTAHYGAKHASDNTSGGYFCWDCHDPHGDRSTGTPSPGTGNIYMIQKVALAKTEGVFGYHGAGGEATGLVTFQRDNTVDLGGDWARSDFRGICQVCHHGNGTGSATEAKFYTRNAFQNHNRDKVCTDCHSHDKNFGAACSTCHGETTGGGGAPPYAPFLSHPWASRATVDNVSVPAGIGNHRIVPAAGIDNSSHEPFACTECHTTSPGSDPLHDTGKDNATLTQVAALHGWPASYGGGPLAASVSYGSLAGGASGGSVTDDSCSNVDCHSPRYGGNAAKSGTPFPYARYWINVTQWDCYTCHGYDGRTATTRPGGALSARIGTGSHTRHLADNVSLACAACHPNHGANVRHKSGGVDFNFPAVGPYTSTRSYSRNGAVPTDNVSLYGTCANLYCHSIVQTAATGGALADNNATHYRTPKWDNAAAGQCGACHGDDPNTAGGTGAMMASGSHQKHIDNSALYRYACVLCHNGAGEGTALHVNGFINVALSGSLPHGTVTGAYGGDNVPGNSNFGKCTVSYCHGTGTPALSGGVNQMVLDNATWGNAATGGCGTCHGAPGGAAKGARDYPTSGAHARHFVDLRGPRLSASACTDCHTAATDNSHVDGQVDFRTSWTDNTPRTLSDPLMRICDPCHASGAAAAKANWASVADVPCLTCHTAGSLANARTDNTGIFAPNVGGDNIAYGALVTGHGKPSGIYASGNPAANQACGICHATDSLHVNNVRDNTYSGNRLLDNVNNVTGLATLPGLCAACHTTAGSSPAGKKSVTTHGNAGYADNLEQKPFTTTCDQCHEPHGMGYVSAAPAGANLWMINDNVLVTGTVWNPGVSVSPVRLFGRTGAYSFDNTGTSSDLCRACHTNAANPGYPMAYNAGGQHAAPKYSGDERGKDCSGCHSHNQDGNIATVDGLMALACNGCHSYPGLDNTGTNLKQMSAGHWKHVGQPLPVGDATNNKGYECTLCHYNYSHNQSNVTAGSLWPSTYYDNVNINFDTAWNPGSTTYRGLAVPTTGNGGTGACAGLYCHGDNPSQTAGWNGSDNTPVWNQPSTGACGTCHDAGTADTTGGTVFSTKNHPGHLTAAYGPGLAAFSAGANCAEGAGCHPKWGLAPLGSHANRAKDLRSTATDNGEVSASLGTTQVCRNCHSTYASSQGTGDTLVRLQANWDNVNYKVACVTCHNAAPAGSPLPASQGRQNPDGSGNRAPDIDNQYYLSGHGKAGVAQLCTACHEQTVGHIGSFKVATNPWRLLAATNHGNPGGLDQFCAACHGANPPQDHTWNLALGTPETKETTDTHPTGTAAVGTGKSRWYQMPSDNNIPLQGNLTQQPHTKTSTENIVCVSCHDPHGVAAAALPVSVRNFSGANDDNGTVGRKMVRYNFSGTGIGTTPLCVACHK